MERKRARTRDSLIAAAQQLLAVRSPDAVNVDEIVEIADVAKGTFYNYFNDKDALIREVEAVARALIEQIITAANEDVTDAATRVARAFAAGLGWAVTHQEQARMLMRMTPHFTDPDAAINAGVRRDVHDGLTSERFKSVTEEAGVVLVLSVMHGGLNRALDLEQRGKVRQFGAPLSEALLVGLGLERAEAEKLAGEAMADLI
ncbi:MAG: helix-turn-helix domain-containing protein [Sphingobium sp.]|nr:helix-turn-helix domain-containing protein [Sphingobium sp.]